MKNLLKYVMTVELTDIQKLSIQKILYKEDITLMIFTIKLLNTLLDATHADVIRFKKINITIK